METIEVLKNVQRIALECMIGRKPVHINVGVMPETGGLCVTVQDRSHDVSTWRYSMTGCRITRNGIKRPTIGS